MMKNRSNKKPVKMKYCALLDKECIGDECMQYYDMFDKCNLELISYNLFKQTEASKELKESNGDLVEIFHELIKLLNKLSAEKSGKNPLF